MCCYIDHVSPTIQVLTVDSHSSIAGYTLSAEVQSICDKWDYSKHENMKVSVGFATSKVLGNFAKLRVLLFHRTRNTTTSTLSANSIRIKKCPCWSI